jgi:predicted transcriptional regulator
MSTRITVSLPEKEHAALAALARQHDVSLSWLTRKAIIEFLNQHRVGSPPQPALGLPPQRKAEGK